MGNRRGSNRKRWAVSPERVTANKACELPICLPPKSCLTPRCWASSRTPAPLPWPAIGALTSVFAGEQVEAGHAVMLTLTRQVETGPCAPDASSCHVPPLRYPFISTRAALSARGSSIAHETGVFPLSVRFCLLPESTCTSNC